LKRHRFVQPFTKQGAKKRRSDFRQLERLFSGSGPARLLASLSGSRAADKFGFTEQNAGRKFNARLQSRRPETFSICRTISARIEKRFNLFCARDSDYGLYGAYRLSPSDLGGKSPNFAKNIVAG